MSSDVHIIKPSIEIYKYLLEKYQLNPEECLFIDDRKDNVDGAKNAGMNAVIFDNNYEIIKELIGGN